MAVETTYRTLSASQHGTQLRRAVIASTIGTTIEWYDFLIYGTSAGLIFGELYFPDREPLAATFAAFGTHFVRFLARPVGAVIFGHYGDCIDAHRRQPCPVAIRSLHSFTRHSGIGRLTSTSEHGGSSL